MKKLIGDPWQDVEKKYKVGDTVEGTILKINPFGFFVELDPEIHGLAHVSELSNKQIEDMLEPQIQEIPEKLKILQDLFPVIDQ